MRTSTQNDSRSYGVNRSVCLLEYRSLGGNRMQSKPLNGERHFFCGIWSVANKIMGKTVKGGLLRERREKKKY